MLMLPRAWSEETIGTGEVGQLLQGFWADLGR